MDCPVCHHKDLSPFATRCPSCEADVVVFPLLEQLEDEAIELYKEGVSKDGEIATIKKQYKTKSSSKQKQLNRMYWLLLLFPILFFWCGKKNIPIRDAKILEKNKELLQKNQSLESKQHTLQQQVDSLKYQLFLLQKPHNVIHIVKEGDNLSSLAKKYLGEAQQWHEIARLNPHITNDNLIHLQDTLEIKLREH